jgi:hypothetical protein
VNVGRGSERGLNTSRSEVVATVHFGIASLACFSRGLRSPINASGKRRPRLKQPRTTLAVKRPTKNAEFD